MLNFTDYKQLQDYFMLALCLWREARGVSDDEKYMVGCVIRNRVKQSPHLTYNSVITTPRQFSSFNANDPNVTKWPSYQDTSWSKCLVIADKVMTSTDDPVMGATFYFDKTMFENPPYWAKAPMVMVIKTGNFEFWK